MNACVPILSSFGEMLPAINRQGDIFAHIGFAKYVIEAIFLILFRNLPGLTTQGAVSLSASVGLSLAPTDDARPKQLIRYAAYAMQKAKRLGRNQIAYYGLD